MITQTQIGWLKEFLEERSLTEADQESAKDIVDSFRKLWKAADAGIHFRNVCTKEALQSFYETLENLKTKREV